MRQIAHALPGNWKLLAPLLVFLLCLGIGIVVRKLLLTALRKWAGLNGHHIGAVIADAIRTPFLIWAAILGADLATRSSEIPPEYVHQIDVALLALWIISLTMIAARIAGNAVRFIDIHTSSRHAEATATLSRNLAQIAVYTLGLMVLLNQMGIDIRPLLTALGVGGLAVALALQDTLANLFAGFYISVAGQIRLGDYIKLNSGEEGYISDITWRSTAIRTLNNNLIFVPNSKLAQANVTNFSMPESKMSGGFKVRAAYGTDAAELERIVLDEARTAAPQIAGLVATDPITVSWLPGFTDPALVLSLNYTIAEFVNQFGVQSELQRRIYVRLKREGISLAAPTGIINYLASEEPTGLPKPEHGSQAGAAL